MPRDLTHIIIAEETIKSLSETLGKEVSVSSMPLHLGSISHDSFLYSSESKLSTKMHGGYGDDVRKPLIEMLDDIRKEKDEEKAELKQAFVFGHLSHIATDSVFHPFVYSKAGYNQNDKEKVAENNSRHRYIETWLDMHFVQEKGYDFDNFRPLRKIVTQKSDREMLSDFFCKNFEKAYKLDEDVKSDFKRGLITQLSIGKITRNQTVGKIIRKLDNFLDGDLKLVASGFYQEDRKIPEQLKDFTSFKHPVTGETVNKTLNELKVDSIERGKTFILAAQKYLQDGNKYDLLKSIPNIGLDTGIENSKHKDIDKAKPVELASLKGEKVKAFMQKGPIKKYPSGRTNKETREKILASLQNRNRC